MAEAARSPYQTHAWGADAICTKCGLDGAEWRIAAADAKREWCQANPGQQYPLQEAAAWAPPACEA